VAESERDEPRRRRAHAERAPTERRARRQRPRASTAQASTTRPTAEQLLAARERLLPDVIAHDLSVLFVGINPGLYSTAVGHHFGRPGNRFWPALALSGLTPHLFTPAQDRELLALGLGITNVVARTTARADELELEELLEGARKLDKKVRHFAPKTVAVLGITAYRAAFERPHAKLGEQPDTLGGARVVVLPNPSGLNAHHQLPQLAALFAQLVQ
jgi:TDG/mug DNA glycosylase family protein